MRIHFIAIGGSAMHNLAIALHKKGCQVTGSDDEIFEPSRSRLAMEGLLPGAEGWDPERITKNLDAVLLGMHARADNPELIRAREMGITIYSYPEYLYEHAREKRRVVIGGSHGKTTITAMILHVMNKAGMDCDYMVGAQLSGFEVMVKLSDKAPVMILEGDEYLTSPIDRRPKFHLYKPDIALLSGVAWDHINVFPTFENYLEQFRIFIGLITPGGSLIYCHDDAPLRALAEEPGRNLVKLPYFLPGHRIRHGITILTHNGHEYPLQIFGKHNLLNLSGAWKVCSELGISDELFLEAIGSFGGASKRLELITHDETTLVYKDFAHAPSKVKATMEAVTDQYKGKRVFACLELHTFSSLNQEFLQQYKGCLDSADTAIVYYSLHAMQLKRLPPITPEQVKLAFGNEKLEVFTDPEGLFDRLVKEEKADTVFLMMSSGNYDGIDLRSILPVH